MLHSVIELARDIRGIWYLCQSRRDVRRGGGILMRAGLAANGPLDARTALFALVTTLVAGCIDAPASESTLRRK